MIHYQLRCDGEHGFDGWFRDSAAFEAQSAAGLVTCPECGSAMVTRALMAPSLKRKGTGKTIAPSSEAEAPAAPEKAGVLPDQVRSVLQRIRAEVEKNCDNVGNNFADEARAIHRGEKPARGIYGDTTPEQAEALADEGVPVSRIPWVRRADG